MKKRFFAGLLALVMMLSVIPAAEVSATTVSGPNAGTPAPIATYDVNSIKSAEELEAAVTGASGSVTIKLGANISVTKPIELKNITGGKIDLQLGEYSITSTSAYALNVECGELSLSDGTVNGGIMVTQGSTLIVYGTTINYNGSSAIMAGGANLFISTANVKGAVLVAAGYAQLDGGSYSSITVEDGDAVVGDVDVEAGIEISDGKSGTAVVNGGTWGVNPSAFVTGSYAVEKNDAGKWQVIPIEPPQAVVVTTEEELKAALKDGGLIQIGANIITDEILKIEKNTKINGEKHTITGTANKVFEVYADAVFNNLTIVNGTAKGRCIDTRTKVKLDVCDCTLKTTSADNNQPLTIGGADNDTVVNLVDTTIEAGVAGYGVISFVKCEVTVSDSSVIKGYNAFYMKDGSDGSKIKVAESELDCENPHPGQPENKNSTAMFSLEADGIEIEIFGGSLVKLSTRGTPNAEQALISTIDTENSSIFVYDGTTVSMNGDGACLVLGFDAAKNNKLNLQLSDEVLVNGGMKVKANDACYPSLQDALNAVKDGTEFAKVELLADATIDTTVINCPIEICGNGYKVTGTSDKMFRHTASARYYSITIENGKNAGRCIETRAGNVQLMLENTELKTTGAGNNQVIVIGGSGKDIDVHLMNTKIDAGAAGYGIVTYNPAFIRFDVSKITGYAAVFVKPADNSLGSNGTDIYVRNGSELSSVNSAPGNPEAKNGFATVVFYDDNIYLEADGTAQFSAVTNGKPVASQAIFGIGAGVKDINIYLDEHTKLNADDVLSGSDLSHDHCIELPEEYEDEIECSHSKETWITDERESSCAEEGYTGDYICESCGEIAVKGTVIPTKPHMAVEHQEKIEPDCTWEGFMERWHCTDCGMVFADEACTQNYTGKEELLIIPATGHNIVNGVCKNDCGLTIVTDAAADVVVAVEGKMPEVNVSESIAEKDMEKAELVAGSLWADMSEAETSVAQIAAGYAKDTDLHAKAEAELAKAGVKLEKDEDVVILVKPYVSADIKAIDTAASDGSAVISLDLELLYDVVAATTKDTTKTVTLEKGLKAEAPKSILIQFAVPADLFDGKAMAASGKVIYIEHPKADGSVYYHEAKLYEDGENIDPLYDYIEFVNDKGFSEFKLMVGKEMPADKVVSSSKPVEAPTSAPTIAMFAATGEYISVESVDEATIAEGKAFLKSLIGDSRKKYKLAVAADLSAALDKTTKIKILVDGVTADDAVIILHKGEDGWEVIPSDVYKDYVVGKFTDLSPVLVYVDNDGAKEAAQAAVTTPAAGTAKPAPTGDSANIAGLSLTMIACAAAIVLFERRRVNK